MSHNERLNSARRMFLQSALGGLATALAPERLLAQYIPHAFWKHKSSTEGLYYWGGNFWNTLPLGGTSTLTHVKFPNVGTSWTQITQGGYTHFGLRPDGTLWGWGESSNGELAQGDTTDRLTSAVQVSGSWTQVVGSEYGGLTSFAAVRTDGTLWAWGYNYNGQLGQSDTTPRSSPVQISGSWIQVFSGGAHILGIKVDSTLWAWGENGSFSGSGGAGFPGFGYNLSSPRQHAGSWVSAASGSQFSLAVKTDGTLWSWGNNSFGQLGQNYSPLHPNQVSGSWSQVAVMWSTAYAIRDDGTLFGWGSSINGALLTAVAGTAISPVQLTTSSWAAVTTAGSNTNDNPHTAALRSDQTLWMWGNGGNGELGQNNTTSYSSPVQVAGSWTQASVGGGVYGGGNGFSHGIKTDGTLWGWGGNELGQLGINSANFVPQALPGSWAQVSRGYTHMQAIKADGTLWGWGDNTNSQFGNLSSTSTSSPVQGSAGSWVQSAAGVYCTFAIRNDASLWFCGYDGGGSGVSGGLGNRTSPTQIAGSWAMVATGGDSWSTAFSHRLRNDGTLWATGKNDVGQLGIGDTTGRSSVVQVSGSWAQISCGSNHAVALRSDGTLWAWGKNDVGQLGVGDLVSRSSPCQVLAGSWVAISTDGPGWGNSNSFAIRDDGTLWGWGGNNMNGYTPVAAPSQSAISLPVQIAGSWTQVSGSGFNTMALKVDGTLWTWGSNENGQLAQSPYSLGNVSSPVQVAGSWSQLAVAGSNTNFAIRTDGALWGWGSDSSGVLGRDLNLRLPVQIPGSWSQLNSGKDLVGALRPDGTAWMWGFNNQGQLGLNDTSMRISPTQLAGSWLQLACANGFAVGIKSNGSLWTWGANSYGQLGTENTTPQSSPVQVSGTWSNVFAPKNGHHLFGIRSDSTLWAWGRGDYGTLGLGDTNSRSSPAQIPGSWVAVSSNSSQWITLALKTDGTMWSWGSNENGLLGLGKTPGSPSQVGGSWSAVWAGINSSYGLRDDGSLWAWGHNGYGQLGLGSTTSYSSPVQVDAVNPWTKIHPRGQSVFASKSDQTLWAWGSNWNGVLGLGDSTQRTSPVQLPGSWTVFASGFGNGEYYAYRIS